ncbi:hypothetical protein [Thermosipho atlanticus]|uniref:Peptidase family S41 n=1 Tax=Thermosipho atlanticus DSM 15807 TaxID=1123380 RepID=A0A1M5SLD6_9BACT|nr:hypothetical protein [Thermosipho atlanticus]SHH39372.1 hypothetical protein SAMN02745199_0943 [Thermosipho atlanticus DSM 15807]
MKRYLNFTFIFIIIVFIIFLISPYVFKYHRYFKRTLQKEIEYVITKVENYHIGRFFNSSFKIEIPEISKMMNRYEFYRFLSEKLNYFPDVYLEIPYQYKTTKLLPFDIRFFNNSFVVINTSCNIPNDAIIRKINGQNIEDIYLDFAASLPGENMYIKKHNFAVFIFPIIPDFYKKNKFEVEYEFKGMVYKETVESITYQEYLGKLKLKAFEYRKINKDIGILKVNHFNVAGKDFFTMLELLENISKDEVKTLLIDMRGSIGLVRDFSGVYMLLSFITDKPHYISDKIYYAFGDNLIKYEKYGYVYPNEINFSNKRLFFISDKSIAHPLPAMVLAFVKKWKLGIIVGKEPAHPVNFYGVMKEFTTQWTGLKVLIPTWYFENYIKDYVEPDIKIPGDYLNYIMTNF